MFENMECIDYKETDFIRIAKRENNKKRTFLLVNPLQGKHLSVSPVTAFGVFKTLATLVYSNKKVNFSDTLIIGFAETATAIGAALSLFAPKECCVNYIQTTRELYEGKHFLYFNEEHSHATDQMVIRDFLDQHIKNGTHIIFAEDEVTTGKTIENFMRVLAKTYPSLSITFGIASILNGMPDFKLEGLASLGISIDYLCQTPECDYEDYLSRFSYDKSRQHNLSRVTEPGVRQDEDFFVSTSYMDTRLGVSSSLYKEACHHLYETVYEKFKEDIASADNILILGTEEFMFPGMFLGACLEQKYHNKVVRFHATTRSPILPSPEDEYPIKERYLLSSFYDEHRTTYLYNLSTYDLVFVLTDSKVDTPAYSQLCHVLRDKHCDKYHLIRWNKKEKTL